MLATVSLVRPDVLSCNVFMGSMHVSYCLVATSQAPEVEAQGQQDQHTEGCQEVVIRDLSCRLSDAAAAEHLREQMQNMQQASDEHSHRPRLNPVPRARPQLHSTPFQRKHARQSHTPYAFASPNRASSRKPGAAEDLGHRGLCDSLWGHSAR